MPTELQTIDDVIKALGGQTKVSKLVSCTPQAVWNWTRYGNMPRHSYFILTQRLKKQGYSAPRSLWGFTEE